MSEVQQLIVPVGERASASGRRSRLGHVGEHSTVAGPTVSETTESAPPVPVPTLVYVYAKDPILRAGIASQLRRSPMVCLVDTCELDPEGVPVIIADELRDDV